MKNVRFYKPLYICPRGSFALESSVLIGFFKLYETNELNWK